CLFVFFFSSRRRHTRFSRDWSSDVCSSDLTAGPDLTPAKALEDGRGGAPVGAVGLEPGPAFLAVRMIRRIGGEVPQPDQVQHLDGLISGQALEDFPRLTVGIDVRGGVHGGPPGSAATN